MSTINVLGRSYIPTPPTLMGLAFVLLVSSFAGAQIGSFEGKRILSIQYSAPDVLHPQDLERVQVLHVGDVLRANDVGKTIDRLFATGRFEDISVEAEDAPSGVAVRFVTQQKWFVGGVQVDGKIASP